MNKEYIVNFFIFVLFILTLSSCAKKPNELEQAGLHGKIKSIREISYQAFGNQDTIVKGEVIMSEQTKNYYAQYNTDGNLLSIINYDNMGEQIDKWIFRYSSEGEALGGNYYLNDNTLSDSTYYVKDIHGNIIEYYHLFADGKMKYKSLRTYNRKGNKLEERVFDHENLLYSTTKFTYKHNNIIKDENYGRNNNLQYFSYYIYDKKDNLVKQTIYNADSTVNTSGTFTYNKKNDIIKSITHTPNEKDIIFTHTYQYDKNDNWIQKITFLNNEALYITIRQFEYYK